MFPGSRLGAEALDFRPYLLADGTMGGVDGYIKQSVSGMCSPSGALGSYVIEANASQAVPISKPTVTTQLIIRAARAA
jgi:hypothetical protein